MWYFLPVTGFLLLEESSVVVEVVSREEKDDTIDRFWQELNPTNEFDLMRISALIVMSFIFYSILKYRRSYEKDSVDLVTTLLFVTGKPSCEL